MSDDGFEVTLLSAPPDECRSQPDGDYAASLGVDAHDDARDTVEVIDRWGRQPDWLIVDHYALGESWERAVRPAVDKLLVIDDLANRAHDCDVLVDQNWLGARTDRRYDSLVPSTCRVLLGPRYALLQPEYAQFRRVLPSRNGVVRRVVVYFGASDDDNCTGTVVQALNAAEFRSLALDVVLGPHHPSPEQIRIQVERRGLGTVHCGLPSLAGLFFRADLAIGAGGATSWERASLGVPSVVAVLAENQRMLTEAMHDEGMLLQVPVESTVDEWRQALCSVVGNTQWLRDAAAMSMALIDGAGATRIGHIIHPSPVRLRRASPRDEAILLEWANDPGVRSQAFEQRAITPEEHARWFAAKLADACSLLLIAEDESGLPLGQVRFDVDTETAEAVIDISVDRAFRGLGVGELILAAALDVWRRQQASPARAIAEVRDGNTASARMFARLGFVPAPRRKPHASMFVYPS